MDGALLQRARLARFAQGSHSWDIYPTVTDTWRTHPHFYIHIHDKCVTQFFFGWYFFKDNAVLLVL